jgi:septum formation protein
MACRLILASQSPRRKALLEQLGLGFEVQVADVDESVREGETAEQYLERVAKNKAVKIARLNPEAIVIAADTTVCIDGTMLAKPEHQAHALQMWQRLSGRQHQVKTCVMLCYASQFWHATVSTEVFFSDLTDQDMFDYWQTGEPQDKAGGYAIQGRAAAWVKRIEGSYSNVVGLPLFETVQLLKQAQSYASE